MKSFSYLILLCFCLYSCEKEQEQIDTETTIIGKTFISSSLSLTFESNDSVSFLSDYFSISGKSKYEIDNGKITIKNPYGRRLKMEETTESYILTFTGYLKHNRIDDVSYFIVGPYERVQMLANKSVTLFYKPKK